MLRPGRRIPRLWTDLEGFKVEATEKGHQILELRKILRAEWVHKKGVEAEGVHIAAQSQDPSRDRDLSKKECWQVRHNRIMRSRIQKRNREAAGMCLSKRCNSSWRSQWKRSFREWSAKGWRRSWRKCKKCRRQLRTPLQVSKCNKFTRLFWQVMKQLSIQVRPGCQQRTVDLSKTIPSRVIWVKGWIVLLNQTLNWLSSCLWGRRWRPKFSWSCSRADLPRGNPHRPARANSLILCTRRVTPAWVHKTILQHQELILLQEEPCLQQRQQLRTLR